MPYKMPPHELEFYQELMAPWADEDLSVVDGGGGRKLTYVKKSALENRLDTVCGPRGWKATYREYKDGLICALTLRVPGDEPGTWVLETKEDGGGPEEMGKRDKTTGEWVPNLDNTAKSGFTNSFRRAAGAAWGMSRYLYDCGIPGFLNPNAVALPASAPALPPIEPGPSSSAPPKELADRQAPPPSNREPQPQRAPQGAPYDNFKIPPPGKSVFAWAKEMQKVFDVNFVDGMKRKGQQAGFGTTLNAWDKTQVDIICRDVIDYIIKLPNYEGQFDHMYQVAPSDPATKMPPVDVAPAPDFAPPWVEPATNAAGDGRGLAALRHTLMISVLVSAEGRRAAGGIQ